ncbi:MAG: alpha-glucan family phosphorylase [Bacteroidota bacterium]|nr:alpha-glucan family phosphorylase [Bacteroidota bacterium]MDP4204379.1 alpha-glucan family phosphorylase [Bacteroidota bacterium]
MSTNGVKIVKRIAVDKPNWKKIFVESSLPEVLYPLKDISRNLWWSWNTEARDLFCSIDPEKWEESEHNPIMLLESVSYQRLLELEKDEKFLNSMHQVSDELTQYIQERKDRKRPSVAYFSMEFGIHDSLKIFSGGLGILAGDYLKEASDSKVNMVGIGLLYRFGYFKQTLSANGEQLANYEAEQFSKIPVTAVADADGKWLTIPFEFPQGRVYARVWEAKVGAVSLYLLDTDFEDNRDSDRTITHQLYGGDNENRLKQEIVLGFGGIRLLKALGIDSDIYHCNEGHAAFIGVERLRKLVKEERLTFAEAKEVVRASTLFTTHTPVPAGHDIFPEDMFRFYMEGIPDELGISWNDFVMLGKAFLHETHFNMSYLAAHLSQGINGVSLLHGEVSKELFTDLYGGFFPTELNIGYVTNGVHYKSWAAQEWKELHKKYFGEQFPDNQLDFDLWAKISTVPSEEMWSVKHTLKVKLIEYIKQRFTDSWIQRHEDPKIISEVLNTLNPNALTIGFARRFATYKRAYLLFRDLDRLSELLNDPERPMQFIFAGKAHPADRAGQDLIKYIIDISKRPEFIGKIIFIPNYDINLAKILLQGVDVWLNTPTRPLEASGTSGEKGVMNGTLHFSVLDGWWVEGYHKDAGWALPQENSYDVAEFQDQLDAETIYNILENEVIPAYYERNDKDLPIRWISYMKNTFAQVAPNFTTLRMLRDYEERFYIPQSKRVNKLKADKYKLAHSLAAWKSRVASKWEGIEVLEVDLSERITNTYRIGESYPARVVLNLNGLSPEDIGIEIVTCVPINGSNEMKFIDSQEFEVCSTMDGKSTYCHDLVLNDPGYYNYAIRIFARHPELPHRQDFRYVRWI